MKIEDLLTRYVAIKQAGNEKVSVDLVIRDLYYFIKGNEIKVKERREKKELK